MRRQRSTSIVNGVFLAAAATVASWVPIDAPASASSAFGRPETKLVLIDASLNTSVIERFGVDGDDLVTWSRQAAVGPAPAESALQMRRLRLAECIAIVRDSAAAASTGAVMLLADGQRFPGELRPRAEGSKGDSLGWRHRWLGEVPSEIDALHALLLLPDSTAPVPAAGDVIVLANGDRLEGVITDIGSVVQIERSGTAESKPEAGGGGATEPTTAVPIGRIAAIGFITPDVAPTGNRLWCADGTIVAALPSMDSETGLLLIKRTTSAAPTAPPAPQPRATPMIRSDEVLGFTPDPSRVTPLAGIAPREVRASGETPRGFVERPEISVGTWPMGAAREG